MREEVRPVLHPEHAGIGGVVGLHRPGLGRHLVEAGAAFGRGNFSCCRPAEEQGREGEDAERAAPGANSKSFQNQARDPLSRVGEG